jgi:hypothetical protein
MQPLGDMPPQIDADTFPGTIPAFHGERRRDPRADNELVARLLDCRLRDGACRAEEGNELDYQHQGSRNVAETVNFGVHRERLLLTGE